MLMSQAISLTFCSALLSWSVVANFFFRSAFCSLVRFAVMISNQLSIALPVDALLDVPAFVKQRYDGLVLDGLADRVGVDEPAELVDGVLVLLLDRACR